MLPAPSTDRAWNVWLPGERLLKVAGLVQVAKAPPSMAHWKLATPLPEKLNVALALVVGLPGCAVIVVSGAVVSIAQV